MKTIKITIATLLLITLANNVKAQATASATASATIVAPIAITKVVDMNFGNASVSASLGTVVLSTGGLRSATGGVTLPATTGTVGQARYFVSGQPSYTFAITLPSSHTITHTNNTDVMIVDNFVSNPASTGTLSGAGTRDLEVGATLNVAGSQLAGVYTSATGFDVTVNYN